MYFLTPPNRLTPSSCFFHMLLLGIFFRSDYLFFSYGPYAYPYYVNPLFHYTQYPIMGSHAHSHTSPPFVTNIEKDTFKNDYYRKTLWTGKNLQVTLMSIDVDDDIGLEVHPHGDQFIRLESGKGLVKMGPTKENLPFHHRIGDDFAIMIPAGTWHNVINIGKEPLKLYAIYAPPEHKPHTIHKTKAIAEASEHTH